MKLLSLLTLVLFLQACAGTEIPIMTRESFAEVGLGMPADELGSIVGKPYSVKRRADGAIVYHYIERFNRQQKVAYQNHYTIVVKDGVVIEKDLETEYPPTYDYLYYDDPIMKAY